MSMSENLPTAAGERPGAAAKPFSIRLTVAEKQLLARSAGRTPLATYIRNVVLSGAASAPRRSMPGAQIDHTALARVLAALGGSNIAVSLGTLARAADLGALPVTPETEHGIRSACDAVMAMRRDLMTALGLTQGGAS